MRASTATLLVGGLVTLAMAGVAQVGARAEIVEQVLVKVNGEIFTKTDLEERQVAALRQRNRNLTQADLQNDAQLKEMLSEVTPQLVVDAIDELLLMQRGKELGYKLSDEQFAQIVSNIRKENKLENEEQFQAALRQEGLTIVELRRNIERQMIISRVQQQDVMEKISVTEAEANAFYEANRNEFTTPAAVTLRELLVAVPDKAPDGQAGVNVGLDEEAKAKAEAIRARILKGEEFGTIAASESDAASKANGGLIGPVNRDELSEALQQLVAKLKVGEVSEPLRSPRGYQLIKLESRSETTVLPLEQVRNQVADRVFREKSKPELTRYLKQLRDQAIIEWKNAEIKRVYESYIAKIEAPDPAKS
jgi:peptidyl-prolyl cis-trans isomerase SurA